MIRLSKHAIAHLPQNTLEYLNAEYERGVLYLYRDGNNYVISFYESEDELAFKLKFGTIPKNNNDTGFYYAPYVPLII